MALATWLNEDLLRRFSGRILPLDADVLLVWGRLAVRLEAQGRPISTVDALIAATCLHHSLILVSRNVSDFEAAGVAILDPWRQDS